jgi:hypothetical protein
MANKVRSVSVVFQAFTDKFEKKLDTAASKASGFGKKVLAGVGGFIAARATIGSFATQMENLVQLANTSRELKVSPQFLQGIDLATEQLGFSFEKAKDVIREFNIRLGEAKTGAGPAVNGLKLINMEIEEFNKLSPEEGFLKVADALSKIEDPQLQIFAAGELFGGAGEDMIGLLQQGEEGLEEFIKKAEELSGPITREDLEAIRESDIAIKEMQISFGGIIQQLAIEMAPLVEGLAVTFQKISDIIKGMGDAFKTAQTALEVFFIEAQWGLGLLTAEEAQFALSLGDDDGKPERPQEVVSKVQMEVKAKLENIKTFSESLRMGTSEAFKALNPTQQVDIQKEQLTELQKQTSELANIGAMIGSDDKIVSF